jgi:hypothetical protein
MILRELFYIDPETKNIATDLRYNPGNDRSMFRKHDTRRTRLTLGQINELRKSSEAHILEQEDELSFINTMYGAEPAAPPA